MLSRVAWLLWTFSSEHSTQSRMGQVTWGQTQRMTQGTGEQRIQPNQSSGGKKGVRKLIWQLTHQTD